MKNIKKCKMFVLNNKRTLNSVDEYTTRYGFLISIKKEVVNYV